MTASADQYLFIAPSAFPLGGVADWLDYCLAGLRANGVRCRLLLVDGGGHDAVEYLKRHPWVNVGVLRNPTGSREGRVRSIAEEVERTSPELVVAVHLIDVYEAVRRVRMKRRVSAPRVIMALHGLTEPMILDIAEVSDVLDGVVATNRLTERLAGEALGDRSRVCYAPYGVPVLAGASATELMEAGSLRLLYAGRIEQEQKRVLDLPPILGQLRAAGINARLSIAGSGPLEPALRKAFETSGLSGAVDWLGDLDPARLAQAYGSHDALVITSVWETGPIVAWEAMSHGLPVASTRYLGSGLEGALRDGETAVLFNVGDVGGAVAAIARLQQAAVRERIVAAGRALVRDRYSREASLSAWKQALDALAVLPEKPAAPIRLSRPSGRLDRWLGVERAEDLRRLLGIRFVPNSPGAAWPHTASTGDDEAGFLKRAALIDRGGSLVSA